MSILHSRISEYIATKDLDERTYDAGQVIFEEGDKGTEMYIVQEGRVLVSKRVGGEDLTLATLERGDFFGEMALLESMPRAATCRAIVPTKLKAVHAGELLLKFRRDPTFAFEMLQQMGRRIRRMDERLVELISDNQLSSDQVASVRIASERR